MTFFLKGLAFGFLLAATVGPMWLLCFRRTLERRTLAGLVSGMGIAVADGIYGTVAAFGLTAVSGFLLEHSFWIGLAGGHSCSPWGSGPCFPALNRSPRTRTRPGSRKGFSPPWA